MSTADAKKKLSVQGKEYTYFDLKSVASEEQLARLPYSLRVLLENLVRNQDGENITRDDIDAVVNWDAKAAPSHEIAFSPARVLLQDFTGVPAVVDLAAMRDAMSDLGGDPTKINPLLPVELVIDHSVQVDAYGTAEALKRNTSIEYERNQERYAFLRWGQNAFDNFAVVPPETGIVHQVNLEYLARVVFTKDEGGETLAYPDTLVGTDSHTTMINGIGVLGWGVGGIEAEAAMLGQPVVMLVPNVVGFKLVGSLPEGATATDLVLVVVQMLREKGVVGKFVEFYGSGLSGLSLADRATIANMAPEYGATCGIFPVDDETLRYLKLTGRTEEQIALVEAYSKAQGLWFDPSKEAEYSDTLELDLSTVEPSLAGPKRPQDRVPLKSSKSMYKEHVKTISGGKANGTRASIEMKGEQTNLGHGDVVIAAITSCTNTSNPAVMLGAGLLAKKAVEKGLNTKPWVKTSLAPGSKVVVDYLEKANLTESMEKLGFNLVGFGCTTCIGNSGPLPEPVAKAVSDNDLAVASVLSGNRNFEGRVHQQVKMNYLASPPLVVAYAIAGTMDLDLYSEPLGTDQDGNDVYLKDIWPTQQEISDAIAKSVDRDMFESSYSDVFKGNDMWRNLEVPTGDRFQWSDSTYIQQPPYFDGMSKSASSASDIDGARVLALLGDSVTTDHISPAGSIAPDSPAARYLQEHGVERKDFNSYGSRRGNHEVMMRGTFANIRLKNALADGKEGGWTKYLPTGEVMSIFDAAMKYKADGTPLVVIAGKEYGTGSSRDWAAKGPALQGVRAVIAESFERIHRSNLIGMGIIPLQFLDGESASAHGLDGTETIAINGISKDAKEVTVKATKGNGETTTFKAKVRIDTPKEFQYYVHGGILQYVLRNLLNE